MTSSNRRTPSTQQALVSGAASGIGRQVAFELDRQGYRLILVDVNETALSELQGHFEDCDIKVVDLLDPKQLEALCVDIEETSVNLAYAFINAGMVTPGNVIEVDRQTLTRDVDLNLRSAMCLNHACARKMKQQGYGHIINTASMAALVSLKGSAAYSASKFGIRGFLIALRSELKSFGVNVSMILPSAIDTPMLRFEARNGGSPLNFISTPSTIEDVVKVFVKVQKQGKLEYFVPYSDSLLGRLVCSFPHMIEWLYPLFSSMGERGRRKFIELTSP